MIWADDVDALRLLLDPVNNLKGEFKQVITAKDGEVIQESHGQFALQRPGYFWWHSAAPYDQTLVGSPTELWIYDPDLEQATLRSQDIHQGSSPVNILTGDVEQIREDFEVLKRDSRAQTEFTLTPKLLDRADYKAIVVKFKENSLSELVFTDKLSQITAVSFLQTVQNTELPKTLFEFTPPPGTDIIRDNP